MVVPCSWFFPRPDEYRRHLEAGGFAVKTIDLFPHPSPLPGDINDWLEIFAQPYTAALPPAEQGAFISDVVEMLRPALCDASGRWTADHVRLRFSAVKKSLRSNNRRKS